MAGLLLPVLRALTQRCPRAWWRPIVALAFAVASPFAAPRLAGAQDWQVERPLGSPEVVERYRQILHRDPASDQALDGLIREYQPRGGLSALIDDYGAQLAQSPDDAALHLVMARLRARNGETEAALSQVDRAIELGWSQREAYLLRGQLRGQLGQLEAAASDFDQALAYTQSDEQRIEVLRALGDMQRAQGRNDLALESYRRITEVAPRDRYVWQELSQVLYEAGFKEEALSALVRVVDLAGTNTRVRAESLRDVGSLQEELGHWQDATETWWRLRDLVAPDSWLHREAEDGLVRSYRGWGRLDELLARVDQILAHHPRDAFALTSRARILNELGRTDEARSAYALAAERLPGNNDFALEYANALVAWGDIDAARQVLEDLITRSPGDFEPVSKLADLLIRQGLMFDASFLLRREESHWWSRSAELWELFGLYQRIGDQSAADRVAQRIAALEPDDQRPLVRLAEAHFQANQSDAGMATLQMVRGTDDPEVLATAIEVLQQYGHQTEAVDWIDEARRRFPDDVRFALAWMRAVADSDAETSLAAARDVLIHADDWDAAMEAFALYLDRLQQSNLVGWAIRSWQDEFDRRAVDWHAGRLLLMLEVAGGHPGEASRTLTRLRAVAPAGSRPDEWVLALLQRWPQAQALPLLHRLAADDPTGAWRYDTIGARLLVQAGRPDEARQRLDALRQDAADRAPVLFEVAQAYQALPNPGDQQTACDLMAQVLDEEPHNLQYRLGLADCLYATGKPSAAFDVAMTGLTAVRDVDSAEALLDRVLRTLPAGTTTASLADRLRAALSDRSPALQTWLEGRLQSLGP